MAEKLSRLILHAGTDAATRDIARIKLARLSGAQAQMASGAELARLPGHAGEQGGAMVVSRRRLNPGFRHWAASPESQVLDILA